MKLKKQLFNLVGTDFTRFSENEEGLLKGGFGEIVFEDQLSAESLNNCLCNTNNCDCIYSPGSFPVDNCNCSMLHDASKDNCNCNTTGTTGTTGTTEPPIIII